MNFKFALLRNTVIGWAILMLATILFLWQTSGFNNNDFSIFSYLFVSLGLFYTILLFNTQIFKRNLIKSDQAVEIGGNPSTLLNFFLLVSFVVIVLALILKEASLLRGPMLLLVAHSYIENNSAIIGNRYVSFGFSIFEKSQISSYEITDKKNNKSIAKIKLNNNRQISVSRSKNHIQELANLLDQSINKPSVH